MKKELEKINELLLEINKARDAITNINNEYHVTIKPFENAIRNAQQKLNENCAPFNIYIDKYQDAIRIEENKIVTEIRKFQQGEEWRTKEGKQICIENVSLTWDKDRVPSVSYTLNIGRHREKELLQKIKEENWVPATKNDFVVRKTMKFIHMIPIKRPADIEGYEKANFYIAITARGNGVVLSTNNPIRKEAVPDKGNPQSNPIIFYTSKYGHYNTLRIKPRKGTTTKRWERSVGGGSPTIHRAVDKKNQTDLADLLL